MDSHVDDPADPAVPARRAGYLRASSAPRSRLLLLVYLTSLVLLLIAGGGLAILASAHASNAVIGASVSADRALAQAILDRLGADARLPFPDAGTTARVTRVLERAVDDVGLVGIALAQPDGSGVIAAGEFDDSRSSAVTAADRPTAALVEGTGRPRLVEAFPAVVGGEVVAVLHVVRDGAPVLASAAAAQRDMALGVAGGVTVLIIVLFLTFRGAQRRLDRQTEQLLESIRRDPLTGLLTHGAAVAILATELDEESRRPVALALIDIDNFRPLNDAHGHELGDEAVRIVAAAVAAAAGPTDVVGRSGPDEFLVVAPGVDARELADRLGEAGRGGGGLGLETEAGDLLPLTLSIGVAVAPLHGRTATELLSAAAMTLGEAKGGGGDITLISRLSYAELIQERRTTFSILDGLLNAIDTRDRYTRRHSEDVARYALFLGRELGVDEELREALHQAALLHDVGKIAVPDEVLRKPRGLTADEMEVMKQHVQLGGVLVRDLVSADLVADGVRYHHERWDGTGYAEGLAGEAIPFIARIIAVADAYSAMTTSRPYRRALSAGVALSRLNAAAGTQLDPRLVDVFVLAMESQSERPLPSDPRAPSYWLEHVAA